jgi:hypothetical protein
MRRRAIVKPSAPPGFVSGLARNRLQVVPLMG